MAQYFKINILNKKWDLLNRIQKMSRLKLLLRFAQESIPDQVIENRTVTGSPQSFNLLEHYPKLNTIHSPYNLAILNNLVDLLNMSIYILSEGRIDLLKFKQSNFLYSETQTESLKELLGITKLVFINLIAISNKLESKDIHDRIKLIKSSKFYSNLSSSTINAFLITKIGGNLKQLITNYLDKLK